MPASRAPTVRQRRLGAALRQLRDSKGLSSEEVAEQLGWSASKISRIETARIGVRVSDVRLLLEVYGLEEHPRGELLALAHDANRKGWWAAFPDLPADYASFIALEDEAASVMTYENNVVPGLMQTEEYARHIIKGSRGYTLRTPRAVDRLVDVRLRRQRLLHPPRSLQLSAVLDESVLLRCVGDNGTMSRQLNHMAEVARLPNLILRVLPLGSPHSTVVGSFILLEFPPSYEIEFPDVVHTESVTATHLEGETATHEYRLAYEKLAEQALSPSQSIDLISDIARDRWSRN
jgi:transcriptional regulator with XRE-family HTH domain